MSKTPARIAGHPIHPMLVALPIGMWVIGVIADVISKYVSVDVQPLWAHAGLVATAGGTIAALVAAIPGFIDLLSLTPGSESQKVGLVHMTVNLIAVAVFAFSVWMRTHGAANTALPLVLSVIGLVFVLVGGWLGGELVYQHAVGVDTES